MLTVFEMAPEMNGWAAAIMRMWAFQGIEPRAVGAAWKAQSKTGRCSGFRSGRALDRVLLVDVGHDRFDLLGRVAQRPQRQRHRLVDDLQHAAAGQLLVLHQGDVRLDARRVAIHHEADRARGGQHGGLGVAEPVPPAAEQNVVPQFAGGLLEVLGGGLDLVGLLPVHLHHLQHGVAVFLEGVERPDGLGQLAAGAARRAVQQGRDRPAKPARLVRVVGQAAGHDQAAEVRVSQSQRAETMAVGRDPLRGIARMIHENFLAMNTSRQAARKRGRVEIAVGKRGTSSG